MLSYIHQILTVTILHTQGLDKLLTHARKIQECNSTGSCNMGIIQRNSEFNKTGMRILSVRLSAMHFQLMGLHGILSTYMHRA